MKLNAFRYCYCFKVIILNSSYCVYLLMEEEFTFMTTFKYVLWFINNPSAKNVYIPHG